MIIINVNEDKAHDADRCVRKKVHTSGPIRIYQKCIV